VGIILLRIVPFLDPTGRFWGFDHLLYLHDYISIGFFIIAIITLLSPFINKTKLFGEQLTEQFTVVFFDSKRSLVNRLALILTMAIVFTIFVMPTHFLGDCYILIKNLSPATGMFFKWDEVGIFKWSEIGIAKFMIMVKSLIGSADEAGALLAFRIVSIVSGLITIWFFFLICRVITKDKTKRILIFISSFLSGLLLMFFGYAEYYHIIWAFFVSTLYFFIKYLTQGRGLITGWIILLIGIVFHMQLAIILPAALYASLCTGRGLIFYQRFKAIIWTVLIISAIGVIAAVVYKYTTDLYIEDMFLSLFSGKPIDPGYAIFSPAHLVDIFNEFILLVPLLFLFAIISIRKIGSIFNQNITAFLFIATIGSFLFLFLIDPKLGMPRDWDLFSLTPFTLTLLFILLLEESALISFRKLMLPIALLLIISPLPYLLTNLSENSSAEYVKKLIKLDSKKTIAGMIILYDYYKALGDDNNARQLGYLYHTNYPTEIKCNEAMDAMDEGDIELASSIMALVEPNKFDASYQRALSRLFSLKGDYHRALKHIDWTIELRRYFSQVYRERAMIYMNLNQHDNIFKDMRKAYQLDDSNIIILEGLTYVHTYFKQYDSCIFYAQRMKYVDSSLPIAYYWLSNAYALKNNYDSANYYINKATIRIGEDSILAVGLNNLQRQINQMKIKGN
ncbi:MAG: hypothetical protein GY865_06535, partial [candidate division Zixibacteria bacterium]|nr:hypothetical protein [candidate division Zixibacteria bacterium]